MLKIKNLFIKLPGFCLKDINLDIDEGDFFAVLGPTGSGKSLLLEAITGHLPDNIMCFSGKVFWKEKDLTCLPPHKRGMGIVYQDLGLFPHMTVEKNIRFGLRYHALEGANAERRFSLLVDTLGLGKILHRYPERISGGERQRVALARVLILNPRVVLLDEPLSSLDPQSQEEAKRLLKRLHTTLGATFVLVSHNFEEVMYLAEQGAVMHNGTIAQKGFIRHIFNRPSSSFVANFVGVRNVFPVTYDSGIIRVGSLLIKTGNHFAYCNPPNRISIRPEKIIALDFQDNHTVSENRFAGRVCGIWKKNFHLHVEIETGGVKFHALWPDHFSELIPLEKGATVHFGFSKKDVHIFREE